MQALHSFVGGRVGLYIGDITEHTVEAIVNAANSSLLGGGGVDGAIHRRGGPAILEACKALRRQRWPDGLPTGEAAITPGGRLPAPYVIHTVGPIYGRHGGEEPILLGKCYRNCLRLAAAEGLASLAFPSISTGVYGYPQDEAAVVVSRILAKALENLPAIAKVRLVFYSEANFQTFLRHQEFGPDPH